MFESLLPAVTLVALGLLVPAAVVAMVLARGRHASASVGGDRGGRVAIAAATVAAVGATVTWLLDGGPVAAATAALLLALPVVVWACLAPWWPVRAVVAWAMLATGAVGTVGIAAARALESSAPWTAVPVAGVGSALVVFVLGRLNGPFRRLLGIRAGIRRAIRTPLLLRPALLRPSLAVAVFFAALAAGGLTGVAPRPGGGRAPEAGSGPDPGGSPTARPGSLEGSEMRPVSAETTTPSESSGLVDGTGTAEGTGSGGSATSADGRNGSAVTRAGDGTAAGTASDGGSTAGGSDGTASAGSSESSDPSGSTGSSGGTDQDGTQSDPVTQVTDTVETVTQTVGQTTDPVLDGAKETTDPATSGGGDGPLDPVTSVVEETVDPVTTVVQETVDTVTDPLGSTLP